MSTLRPGDVLQDRYRIDRLLGEGGMSWVYRGHHLLLEHAVAVKVIKPLYADPQEAREHVEQLRVEAGIMARLEHPNLVRALDLFHHGDDSVLILEMVEGRNLDEVAQLAPKPIAQRRVLAWTAQILDALEYLHSQEPPVIVRDLKPGNIMLGKDGRIRLIDFGLAKRMDKQGSGTRAFVRGMGSEGYAPLEQYAQASTDARSDLYAVGATMYFLLTKVVPPPASLRVADEAALADPRVSNPTVTATVWSAMQSLLSLRPDGRPSNAAEARKALGIATAAEPTRESVSLPNVRGPRRRCVSCQALLHANVKQGIEVDVCRECGGVWLDRGELERLMELGREALSPSPQRRRDFTFQGPTPPDRGLEERGHRSRNDDRGSGRRLLYRSQQRRQEESEPLRKGLKKLWNLLEDLLK